MSSIIWPKNRDEALDTLDKFQINAYAIKYKDHFQRAIDIVHGHDVEVTFDLSKRMTFKCKTCNRDMNCIKSLQEHCQSGSHLKLLDNKRAYEDSSKNVTSCERKKHAMKYPPNSIQHHILLSQAKILGIQFIEEYKSSRHRYSSYYKCILCGAHGKQDAMLAHIKGNSHTEKYMKSRLEIKVNLLTLQEKEDLRCKIFEKEGLNLDDIVLINGCDLYPFLWANSGLKFNKKQTIINEKRPDAVNSRKPVEKEYLFSVNLDNEAEYSFQDQQNTVTTIYRNPSPPPAPIFRFIDGGSVHVGVQAFTVAALEDFCIKLNFMNRFTTSKCTDIKYIKDEKCVLDLSFALGKMLHSVYKKSIKEGEEHEKVFAKQQINELESYLGRIRELLKLHE